MVAAVASPGTSIGRVLDALGGTLLELAAGSVDERNEIDGVLIYDPLDDAAWPARPLALGIGLNDPGRIAAALDELGVRDCVGLVVRSPVRSDPIVEQAANRNRVPVLGLAEGAAWAQLLSILTSLLAQDNSGSSAGERLGGMPFGDLFAVANAVAALLDAPVTIEDRNLRVLAFSARQEEADGARIGTVLGRRVSEESTRTLRERGVIRDLYASSQPVFIEPSPEDIEGFTQPRLALAVRAGNEVLGSIWAAVQSRPSDDLVEAFCDVGKLVALHLLNHRAGADTRRRMRADLVSAALDGGTNATEAVRHLGLSGQPSVVLALALRGGTATASVTDADRIAEREHAADAFALHLSAAYPGSAVALLGDVAYGIVVVGGRSADADRATARVAGSFLERMAPRTDGFIGVGSVALDTYGIARSRDEADRALRVLSTADTERRVASIAEVAVDALLMELSDLCAARGEGATGAVARLLAYDLKHRTFLVQSLRAWLDALGDVALAAKAVHVHPNTFRYRLRRLAEIGGLDLSDADARFAAMVQLRVFVGG